MGSTSQKAFKVRRVAIIGAGPCGLCAARYLKAQGAFDSITIYEQQDEAGGTWNYSSLAAQICPAPQEDPFYPADPPIRGPHGAPIFPSPMYDQLHANIPQDLMRFSDQTFPPQARLFPSRELIQEYLLKYAEGLRGLVKWCFQVKNISLRNQDGNDVWDVEAQSTMDEHVARDTYDAVVVANGHYSVPFIPQMKNLEAFNKAHPSTIIHSKHYRSPRRYADRRTLVVGNGPSGLDIAAQINQSAKTRVLLSVRHATPPAKLARTGCEEVPEIEEFLVGERGVRFRGGRVETALDAVVFCTGFLFSYPFLPGLQKKLITNGYGVHGLYKHLFYIDHPTLVFPGLNLRSAPWPLAEAQAAVVAAAWSNAIALPCAEEMERWARELYQSQGEALHVFRTPLSDGHYMNELHDWAMTASYLGKEPPYWDNEMLWQRSICSELKLRFEQGGCKANTVDELGFHYDPDWRPTGHGDGDGLLPL